MKWTQEHDDWPGRSSKWAWQHDDWPRFEYDHTKAYALSTVDFQLASRQLHGNIEALSASDRVETLTNLMLSEVLNTNLIEGEILNRDSVRSSLLVLRCSAAKQPEQTITRMKNRYGPQSSWWMYATTGTVPWMRPCWGVGSPTSLQNNEPAISAGVRSAMTLPRCGS